MVIKIMLEMLSEVAVFIVENALLGVFALVEMIISGNIETRAGLIILVIMAGGSAIVCLEAPRLYEEVKKSKKKAKRKTRNKSNGRKKTNQVKKATQKDKTVGEKRSGQKKSASSYKANTYKTNSYKPNSYKPKNTKNNAVKINTKKEIVTPGVKERKKKKI